jgi:hypothetical protein
MWAYWEPAILPKIRTLVYNGNVYNDASLACTSAHSEFLDTTDCGVIALMQGWLFQGKTSVDPVTWRGCTGGTQTYGECGAVPLAPIQHMFGILC